MSDEEEILEHIRHTDINRALVPATNEQRMASIRESIHTSVGNSFLTSRLARNLVSRLEVLTNNEANRQYNAEFAGEGPDQSDLNFIESIRRAGKILEEIDSPHLNKFSKSFKTNIGGVQDFETFINLVVNSFR